MREVSLGSEVTLGFLGGRFGVGDCEWLGLILEYGFQEKPCVVELEKGTFAEAWVVLEFTKIS